MSIDNRVAITILNRDTPDPQVMAGWLGDKIKIFFGIKPPKIEVVMNPEELPRLKLTFATNLTDALRQSVCHYAQGFADCWNLTVRLLK